MIRPRFVGGAMLAAVAAGPCFVLAMLILLTPTANLSATLTGVWPALFFATPFGFVAALIPSVLASAALVRLGRRSRRARHPVIWATSGFVIGTVVGASLIGLGGTDAGPAALLTGAAVFGVAGVPCALLARWRTRWPDGMLSYTVTTR